MCSFDSDGNYSDVVKIELINKTKEYEIETKKDVFGKEKSEFKFPDDLSGLIAVITSILQRAVKKKIVDKKTADRIVSEIKEN